MRFERRMLMGSGRRIPGGRTLMVLAACLMAGWATTACSGPGPPEFRIGGPAPGFTLPDLEGTEFASSSMDGEVTVVNFWGTWCLPCRDEIPVLNELAADPTVRVVAIALNETGPDSVQRFVEEHGIEYRVLMGDEETFRSFGGINVPYTVLVTPDRTVHSAHRVAVGREVLAEDIAAIRAGG